ncbi:MAG: N-acetylmuramoyl-L-alanine amidase [Armatimonadota bacterium]|nr:N-acetylmuramoyl-L-alanine amidase [Armatimonadota bacterium]
MAFFLLAFLAVGCSRAETPVRVLYGTTELSCSPSALYDGTNILVPISCLEALGISCQLGTDSGKVAVVAPNGRSGEVDVSEVSGVRMVALDSVFRITGGELVWDESKTAAQIYAHLQSVEFVDDTLKINCSFPVKCTTHKWQNKFIVDIPGTKLASDAREVYIGGPVAARARLGQYNADTARVVIDLLQDARLSLGSGMPSAQLVIFVGKNQPKSVPEEGQTSTASSALAARVRPYLVEGLTLESKGDDAFELVIRTSARAQVAHSYGAKPPEIEVVLKSASLSDGADQFDAEHPLLESIRISRVALSTQPGVKLILSLRRIVAYDVSVSENVTKIRVRLPDRAGGTLGDKVVVIDPGHGGREKGARWGDVYEKDVNLRIAKALKAALEQAGAAVIMTRDDDTSLSLAARAELAIKKGADFFISIHCNSNSSPGSATGIETYYHMDESSPKALAYAVHAGVCCSARMTDRRARSDRSLYASGLGVLRRLSGSGIPGVLIECGYLNHPSDRSKLLDPTYRAKLAEGIVAGLKAYVEGVALE